MTTLLSRACTAAAIVLGLNASVAMAQPSPAEIDVPAVPHALKVPAGHDPYLVGHAIGTQNYVCLPTATGAAWRFIAPQATLFQSAADTPPQQITTHFLSANPVENGTARPTWQHSSASSRIWGRAAASSTDANYVEAGAIAWLLVEIAGSAAGPSGGAALGETTYIHRLNTSGGVAPATGCGQTSDIGAIALVPYTTDYYFYRYTRKK